MTLRELNLSSSYKCRHILCQVSETGNYFYSRHFKNRVDRLERLTRINFSLHSYIKCYDAGAMNNLSLLPWLSH